MVSSSHPLQHSVISSAVHLGLLPAQELLAAGEGAVQQETLQARSEACAAQLQAAQEAAQRCSKAQDNAQASVNTQKAAIEHELQAVSGCGSLH